MDYLYESLKLALDSLFSNKLRTFLTTLGVIIGVAAVITLVSLGEGAKTYVTDLMSSWGFGANSIDITYKQEVAIPEITLTLADADALKNKIPSAQYVVPNMGGNAKLRFGQKEHIPLYTMGTSQDYPDSLKHKVAEGRFFTKAEVGSYRKVCVLGTEIVKQLFGGGSPVGEKIKIKVDQFTVLGVLEEKGSVMTLNYDDMVFIPVTVAAHLFGTNKLVEIYLTGGDRSQLDQLIRDSRKILISRHKKEDFEIYTLEGTLDIINNVVNALTGIVGAIAAISLIVGGIGIMNIMLVTVAERTREIGIRKAIGAKNRDIFWQFLIEAISISLAGTLLGVLAGTLAAWGIMTYLKLGAVIAYTAGLIASVGAVISGGFFGVYPAMRAAGLSPVEALRRGQS